MNLKSACLLLGLCYAGSAVALGLGELSVRSNLGQPLHVTVKVLGAGASTSADCFSIAPSESSTVPPPKAQLSLERGGNQTLLHIRTTNKVYDPFAQFELISDCEARLRRDYVVLLDPPAAMEAVIDRTITAIPPKVEAPIPAGTPRTTNKPRKSRQVKRTTAPSVATATASSPTLLAAPAQTLPPTAPRLVLSGKHGAGNAALSLRLDLNLPDLTRPLPDNLTPLTPTELSDENTALTRKLAYLESQLAALHKRNADLEAKRASRLSASPLTPPASSRTTQWPMYLLAIGVLGGTTALVFWARRRSHRPRKGLAEAWRPTGPMTNLDLDTLESGPWTQPLPPKTEEPVVSERIFEIEPPTMNRSTEVKEDIIDQAEVYVAHGHGDLAIHMLQEHLRDNPPDSPTPWLLLLDLLHREGDTENYAAASAECRRHFNIALTGHPISQDNQIGRGLEAYPHLTEQLVKLWNTPDIEAFFEDLIFDRRGGTRIGFEPCAYREILLLRAISRDANPFAPPSGQLAEA